MSNERILSHKMSKKLDLDEIKNVSAAAGTNVASGELTYGSAGRDGGGDVTFDL